MNTVGDYEPRFTDRELLEQIAEDAASAREDAAATRANIAEIHALVDGIKDQVEPLIDAISTSPMLKMLLPKGVKL